MQSFSRALLALPYILALASGSAIIPSPKLKRDIDPRACEDPSSVEPTFLVACLRTVQYAVEALADVQNNFTQACEDVDYSAAISLNLDVGFLKLALCNEFDGAGITYDDPYTTIAYLAFTQDVLIAAEASTTDPALTIGCPIIDLDLLASFKLSAAAIFNTACSGLFLPLPVPVYPPYPTNSTTTGAANCSSATATAPPNFPTPALRKITRRADAQIIDQDIKWISSALFAISLIQTWSNVSPWCGEMWISAFDGMGYDGEYVESWV
jgi:hypothetical protein